MSRARQTPSAIQPSDEYRAATRASCTARMIAAALVVVLLAIIMELSR